MNHILHLLRPLSILLALAAGMLFPSTAASQRAAPPGFREVLSQPGSTLYQKDYEDGTPDYVQVARLDQGAALQIVTGKARGEDDRPGMFGGPNPRFERQLLSLFWNQLSLEGTQAFCITNAAFFSTAPDPAPLALPLKQDGKIISEGYGADEYAGQVMMLEMWGDRVQISPLTADGLKSSSAPDIIAGLAETAAKDPSALTGRTFAGTADADGDGVNESLLILTTRTAAQVDAAQVLRDFGANQVIMFDGGDSTQLICEGSRYITTSRLLPQALVVLHARPQGPTAEVVRQTAFPVLVEGERADVEITLRNNGADPWRAGEVRLVNTDNPFGAQVEYPLAQDVPAGQIASFSWTTETFPKWGIYVTEWQLEQQSTAFAIDPLRVSIVVLPKQLGEKREELEGQVREWGAQKAKDVEARIMAWIQDQLDRLLENATQKICGSPLLPVLSILALLAYRKKIRP